MDDSGRPRKLRKLSNSTHAEAVDLPYEQSHHSGRQLDQAAHDGGQQLGQDTTLTSDTNDGEDEVPVPNGGSNAAVARLPGLSTGDGAVMSKNQLKKIRKKIEWEAGREGRKAIRKEKAVAKRERKRAAKEAAIADGTYVPPDNDQSSTRPVQLPITFIIDCDFDDLMSDSERMSLGAQLTRAYSDNKKSSHRAHLTISSFSGHLKERFDTVLKKTHESWHGVRFLECDFVDAANHAISSMDPPKIEIVGGAFERFNNDFASDAAALKAKGEIVYLSSDAEETLHELKPFSTYIIGGLVDRNREKGLCYRRATERGIKTARLPIGTYLDMQSRKILATNHVALIMLKWLQCNDWASAFMQVIPKRKGGILRDRSEAPGSAPKVEREN